MVEAKASGIGICPNVNDPHPPSRGICTRTCRWTLSSSCLQVARKANQSSFVFVHNYRQTFVCWNERVPAWWINHRSRPTIRTFRNWVEESWWYSVCSLLLANIRLLYIFIIIVENKFHLLEIRNIKLQGDFLIQEHFDILKTVRIGYVKFCHTPAISHVCNNLRSLWYSPPFRINLSMPQDSPPLTDQFDMIWGWGEVFTRASLAATLFFSD